MFLLNNFCTNPVAHPALAEWTNSFEFLYPHAKKCWQVNNRIPNYVMIDHYHLGDIIEVIDSLNGITLPY